MANGSGVGLMFDEFGLVAGSAGRDLWPGVCLRLEAQLEEGGWDQPAQLFAVMNPVDTEARTGLSVDEVVAAFGEPEEDPAVLPAGAVRFSSMFSIHPLAAVQGQPVESLWGHSAPEWTAALLLAFEGWTIPEEVARRVAAGGADPYAGMRASVRPDRVELRAVHMLTRTGESYAVLRTRGGATVVEDRDEHRDVLTDVMRRMLGLPTAPPPELATGDFLGRLTVLLACEGVAAVAEDGSLVDVGSARSLLEQLRAELAESAEGSREDVLRLMFTASLTAGITQLTRVLLPDTDVPSPTRAGVDRDAAVRQLVPRAREAAAVPFTRLVATERIQHTLPPEVVAAPAGWADDGVAYRRVIAQMPPTDVLLARARDLVGGPVTEAEELLDAAGWLRR